MKSYQFFGGCQCSFGTLIQFLEFFRDFFGIKTVFGHLFIAVACDSDLAYIRLSSTITSPGNGLLRALMFQNFCKAFSSVGMESVICKGSCHYEQLHLGAVCWITEDSFLGKIWDVGFCASEGALRWVSFRPMKKLEAHCFQGANSYQYVTRDYLLVRNWCQS